MTAFKLEYIWLDGYKPTQSLRSKTKIERNFSGKLEDCPIWCFDGSSTEQAPGGSSDCLLKPAFICPDPDRKNAFLVMCEVLNSDGTPHESNGRATIMDDDNDFWFGFEQEYFIWDLKKNKPIGWSDFTPSGEPGPQGPYYCSVGAGKAVGRDIVEEHLERTTEKYGFGIEWHCKPLGATDWNGSGMHANFSNTTLRTCGSKDVYSQICEAFAPVVKEHIAVYGADNHMRLTGKHETQSIDQFSFGVSDRGASIRIPIATVEKGWKGWLEDRRPNSAADPYKVAAVIIKTVKTAKVEELV